MPDCQSLFLCNLCTEDLVTHCWSFLGVSLPLAHGVPKLLVISSPARKGGGQEQPVVSRGLRVPVWRWQGEGEGEGPSHTGQCVKTHLQGSTPKPCCLEWQQRCPRVHFLRPMVLEDSVPRYWAVGLHCPHFVCPPLTLNSRRPQLSPLPVSNN